ncbi:hypothetical protein FPANT_10005 [Fusarium pseudoanthophilum]|uniref:DUF7136 domain-containing protein n=1 Tax=Fusarium pseudoanthophilum TaxID=48495 RepID=A0A8H5KR28_9HYPO|nr:hypothetical protein FPANT_10005 [Fusarium pseudoanthophilum]
MLAQEEPLPPFPIDLGVSLIFPRPNETYRPVYPFPIVFSLTGAAKAWPYGFRFSWSIEGNWSSGIKVEDLPYDEAYLPERGYSSGSLKPADEPYYYIIGTDLIMNTSSTTWELGWSLSVLQECSPEEGGHSYWKTGYLNFSISPDGSLPSFKPKDACPIEIHHLRFLDNRTTPKSVTEGRISESCVVVADVEGEGDSCSVNTGSELENLVTTEMLKHAQCPGNQSWPDEENLLGPDSCRELYPSPKESAEGGAQFALPYAATSIILGALVTVVFFM